MNKIKECRYGKVIYNDADEYIGKAFDAYGEYSQLEINFLKQCINEGDVVFDIGANIGGLTMAFSKMVGESGRVFAFEPQRWVFYNLCGNISVNNMTNVYCINAALGEEAGSVTVPELDYSKEFNYGGLSLLQDWEQDGKKLVTYPVQLTTIDHLPLRRCNLIKIDVEGMELEVLKGGEKTIQSHKPFLYVETDRNDAEEIKDYIKWLGYKVYPHQPFMYNPDNFLKTEENIYGNMASNNIFCIHESRNIEVSST